MIKSTKRMMMFLVPLVIFVLLIVMLFFRLGKDTEIIPSQTVGKPLPAISLPLLSDPARTMTNADLPKTPFIVNVWGSWCPTCIIEHPFLMQLHNEGVPMIGVNYKDELANALDYLNKHKDPFIFSVQDSSGTYAMDLGLTGAPESFVVGTDGVVYKHVVGEVGESNWQSDIKPCLDALADDTLDSDAKMAACR